MTSNSSQINLDAEIVYEYHRMHMAVSPASAIFCLCSLDTRVATRAAQLFLAGYGEYLIYSGGSGKLTANRFSEPEAEIFAGIARDLGVPADKIIVEPNSGNTGENLRASPKAIYGKKDICNLQQTMAGPQNSVHCDKP
ncbi:DUF218 domain-containing protein [Colletotrichum fioriniae PJ7]|uniref:DUF218 domain-containing protein n=1 Tax=Colletotrichum fioriniae PJ7 TaxID=1445577 RepID=A0A010RBV1_9PEZI|nr:DUF218 domain-containing protein [Colletotrichum fioriniae PJ7]